MRTFTKVLIIFAFGAMLGLAGCEKKGPMEKAGEKIDNTVHDATHDGPMENAGEHADKAWDKTKDAAKNAGDAVDGDDN